MSSSPANPEGKPTLEYVITPEEDADLGRTLYSLFVRELVRRLKAHPEEMTASELELIRKVGSDNSITIASIRRGDFGETAKRVAEEFPFPEGPQAEEPTVQ